MIWHLVSYFPREKRICSGAIKQAVSPLTEGTNKDHMLI